MTYYLAQFVNIFFNLLSFAIVARILLSWFPSGTGGNISLVLHNITDPVLEPFQKIVPRIGMMDFSPVVALLCMDLVRYIILSLLV